MLEIGDKDIKMLIITILYIQKFSRDMKDEKEIQNYRSKLQCG